MKNNRTLALVLMIIIVGFLNADQNVMNSTLVLIEKEFAVNDAAIGLMSGLFTILGAVVSIVWGYLTDKRNRKLLFVYSILLGQIPCLLTAFVQNYPQFFILRILTGIGVGVSFPTIFSLIGDMYGEKERASAVTWMVTVIGLGQIIGQLLGGYLGPALGWRFPFIVSALPGLIVLPFFYFFVSEPKRGATEESLKALIDGGYVYSRTIKLSDYVQLVKVRTNLYLFVQGLVGTIPWGAIPLFLVKFLSESRGFSIQEATTVFLFFGIGTTLGTIFGGLAGGALFKRKPSWLPLLCAITTFAGAFMAMLIFILPLGKDLLLTLAFGLVASFIASVTNPNVKTMLLDVNVPENRGSIFSIFNLTDSVGTGFGKFIGGILSVALGTGAALSISSAMWIPCAVLLLVISYIFSGDIRRMQQKLQAAASQMKGVPRPI
ncbi:MAG: MFS transporter [Spirochaetia bacterium]|jgi:predicted MFS family arabinose efflux permease